MSQNIRNNNIYKSSTIQNCISALDNKKYFKLICGASLTNPNIIESLSFIYSLSGANCIDISSDFGAIEAAKKGIEKAKKYYEKSPKKYPHFTYPVLMISINASDDPHFKTAQIDPNTCTGCGKCIPECSFCAILFMSANKQPLIQGDLCYGCGSCTCICPHDSISLLSNKSDLESTLTKLIDDSINGIEIHVGSATKDLLEDYWKKIESILENKRLEEILISFSLESSLYSDKEFVEYSNFINMLTPKKPIIQIDGKPMSGTATPESSLQALASGQVLAAKNNEFYIQLAGGINHLTRKYIKEFKLNCNGIAMGTFARKMVWPYIRDLNNDKELDKAIRIATYLVRGLEF